jgi:hypothetical protein
LRSDTALVLPLAPFRPLMPSLSLRARSRALVFSVLAALLSAACADGPTTPSVPCQLTSVGAPLSFTVGSAATLRPVLEDLRDRVIPAIASAEAAVDESVLSLTTAVTSGDRAASCAAFNVAASAFLTLESIALPEEAPDVDVVRLALGITRHWLLSN